MRRLLLLSLLTIPSWGAIAFVQASSGGSQASSTTRTTGAVATTKGNINAVGVRIGGGCATETAVVTDTAGNTYYEIGRATTFQTDCVRGFLAFDIVANASNVVTVTFGGAQTFSYITALEFSGVDKATPRDPTTQIDTGGGFTVDSTPFSTFYSDEVMVFFPQIRGITGSWTPPAGYTVPSGATPTDNVITGAYHIYSATQTALNVTFTNSASSQMSMVGIGLIKALRQGNAANAGSIK